jgi:hypothetical protein
MRGKLKNVAMIIGVSFNVLLVLFFVYLYYYSIPKPADIVAPLAVTVPKIENIQLKNEIDALTKVEGIPIIVDPTETGKLNPYNP